MYSLIYFLFYGNIQTYCILFYIDMVYCIQHLLFFCLCIHKNTKKYCLFFFLYLYFVGTNLFILYNFLSVSLFLNYILYKFAYILYNFVLFSVIFGKVLTMYTKNVMMKPKNNCTQTTHRKEHPHAYQNHENHGRE